jgi:hypothetical protein
VVCSCDVGGKVLVWTVSRVTSHASSHAPSSSSGRGAGPGGSGGGGGGGGKKCIISRRPQRQFLCPETPHMGCDLSWSLGLVAASHDARVSIFSIERNERFVSFEVLAEDLCAHACDPPSSAMLEWSTADSHTDPEPEVIIRRISLCDDGFVVLALTLGRRHVLATYTIRGLCVQSSCRGGGGGGGGGMSSEKEQQQGEGEEEGAAVVSVASPVTFLSVPGRGNVGISGHQDGLVVFFDVHNLQLLHQFRPHDHSLTCIFSHSSSSSSAGGGGGADRSGVVAPSPEQSAVLCARLGPDSALPAVLVVTTASGGFYVCALPDFAKWDRSRSQSALSQLVQAPLAAVRGSLQQAQHLSLLASDGAGQLAQNAKSMADDAFAKVMIRAHNTT